MGTMFALVMTIAMANGDFQDAVVGVYDNQQECQAAAAEQKINGECWPVDGIIRNGEQPAGF